MKRIGCLTFHAAYNFGSALQTYALKRYVETHFDDVDYHVINFRIPFQQKLYKSIFEKHDLKSLYCRLFSLRYKKQLKAKNTLFENFISKNFKVTKPINTFDQANYVAACYNTLICGSDQIWNIRVEDFSWVYFADFPTKMKRISYACSAGTRKIEPSEEETQKMKKALSSFSYISTRDNNTYEMIKNLGYESTICVDPTLLLDKKDWEGLVVQADSEKLPKTPYIFYYDLKRDKANWAMAKSISKMLKMPVVIATLPFPRVIHKSSFAVKRYDSGPNEFLMFIKNASLVLTTSFHGTLFSCIFEKPFFVLNSNQDKRIGDFLSKVGLTKRMVTSDDYRPMAEKYNEIEFTDFTTKLNQLKKTSVDYLAKALSD